MELGCSSQVADLEPRPPHVPAVCRTLETQPHSSPFVCMDLTYISLLLQEFGFPRNKVLKVSTAQALQGVRAAPVQHGLVSTLFGCLQADTED